MSQQEPARGVVKIIASGSVVKLKHPSTIVGREKADILVDDSEVSASHCHIQEIDGDYFIFDMNSTNGTYLNDKKVIKAKLARQDVIRIGKSQFQFDLVSAQQASTIPLFDKYEARRTAKRKTVLETLLAKTTSDQSYALKIHVSYPNREEEILNLTRKETYLGKDSFIGRFACDNRISAKHLLIKISSTGEVFVEDQQSRLGTYINGKRIDTMHKITVNDSVRIGATTIRIIN